MVMIGDIELPDELFTGGDLTQLQQNLYNYLSPLLSSSETDPFQFARGIAGKFQPDQSAGLINLASLFPGFGGGDFATGLVSSNKNFHLRRQVEPGPGVVDESGPDVGSSMWQAFNAAIGRAINEGVLTPESAVAVYASLYENDYDATFAALNDAIGAAITAGTLTPEQARDGLYADIYNARIPVPAGDGPGRLGAPQNNQPQAAGPAMGLPLRLPGSFPEAQQPSVGPLATPGGGFNALQFLPAASQMGQQPVVGPPSSFGNLLPNRNLTKPTKLF